MQVLDDGRPMLTPSRKLSDSELRHLYDRSG